MTPKAQRFRRAVRVALRITLWTAGIAGVAGCIFLALWFSLLPGYLEDRILPSLAARFGLDQAGGRVRRIGLTGADLAELTVSDEAGGSLRIDSLRVNYTPHLLGGGPWLTVDELVVSGVELSLQIQPDGSLTIQGLDPAKLAASVSSGGSESSASPVALRRIRLEQIDLIVGLPGGTVRVPGRLTLDLSQGGMAVSGEFDLRSGRCRFAVAVDPDAGVADVELAGRIRLEHFREIVPRSVSGTVEVSGRARVELAGTRPQQMQLALTLSESSMPVETARFELRYDQDGLSLDAAASLPWGNASATLSDGRLDEAGLTARLNAEFVPGENLPVSWPEALRLRSGLLLTSEGVTLEDGVIELPESRIPSLEALVSACEWTFEAGYRFAERQLEYTLESGPLTAKAPSGDISLPGFSVRGTRDTFALQASGIAAALPDYGLEAAPVSVDLSYPACAAAIHVESVRQGGRDLAGLDLSLALSDARDRLDFSGAAITRLPVAEPPEIQLSGILDFSGDYLCHVELPLFRIEEGTDLQEWFGFPLLLDGAAAAECTLQSQHGRESSSGRVSVVRSNAALPAAGVALENINIALEFDDLTALRTPAGQRLTVGRIRAGEVDISHGEIKFQIASPRLIHLEESSFDWCDGVVSSRYLRIVPGRDEYQTSLFCEGINLARLLSELGLARAEGDGRLWGKVPVSLSLDGVIFDPGYLYSVPGEEGSIKLSDASSLVDSMSRELARSTHVDLALEALRDFNYEWARINFATVGDDLQLQLQFNGKPNRPLPFNYDHDTGELVRVSVGGGAIFQGIELELNVSVQLNRLLRLHQHFNQIWKGFSP